MSVIILGCTLVATILQSGLTSFISLENSSSRRQSLSATRRSSFSLVLCDFTHNNATLANTSETHILALLGASLAVYLTYIVSLTLMAFFAKKRVYDHHLGFFGNLLNRTNTARPDRAERSAHPIPVDTRDDAVTPLFAGLVFIKSPHHSQATYPTFE